MRADDGTLSPDTLGRSIVSWTDFDPLNTNDNYHYSRRYTITDANETPLTYTLNFIGNVPAVNPWETQQYHQIRYRRITILNSIDLPDGHYTFTYNHPQGFLTGITLPTGGSIKYSYSGCPSSAPIGQCAPANFSSVTAQPESDQVTDRHVSYDSTNEQVWTYTGAGVGCDDIHHLPVVVMSPITTERVLHCFDTSGLEVKTIWQESSGGSPVTWLPRKTVVTEWLTNTPVTNQPYAPRVKTITTTIGTLSRKTAIHYDAYLNVDCQREWDWSSATYTANDDCSQAPSSPLILQKNFGYSTAAYPAQRLRWEEIRGINPETNQFELQGKTEYVYDEGTLTTRSGVPNNNQAWITGAERNLTSVLRHKDSSNCITGGTNCVKETFTYDILGNVLTRTDAEQHTTTIAYDDNFQGSPSLNTYAYATQQTDAENHVTAAKYDYNTGLVVQTTDERGQKTTRTWDLFNRPVDITEPGGRAIHYTYTNAEPKVVEQVKVAATGELRTTETHFDKFYRTVKTIRKDPIADDAAVDTEYDTKGRVYRVSEPYRTGSPVWTTTDYDVLDQPVKVTHPDAAFVSYFYTANAVTVADEAGVSRTMTSNALDQLIRVEEPNPANASSLLTTAYTYYVFGPMRQVRQNLDPQTQQPGQTRTFSFDWLGRKTDETHPESGLTTFDYYENGLVHHRTDARQKVTTYSYDHIGRVVYIDYSDTTPDVAYAYDQNGYAGFLTSVSANNVTSTTYTYTPAGQLASETTVLNGVSGTFLTSYAYDLDGRLTRVGYPSGRVVERNYQVSGTTAVDRIQTIVDQTTLATLVSSVSDNAAGQVTLRTFGNSLNESHSYNNREQVTGIGLYGDTNRLSLSYDYGTSNNVGRIRSRTDVLQSNQSVSYTYDALYRLKDATNSNWSIHWDYDAYGNRTSQTPTGGINIGSQTMNGWVNNKHSTFGYDNAGNVTSDGQHNYTFDAEGRITAIDGGTVQFAYDSEGRRIKKVNPTGSVTYYFYGLTGLMSEFTTESTGASMAATTNQLQYRVAEQTGTAVIITDANGNTVCNNRVFPFGESWDNSNCPDQRFTTYDRESLSNLDYAMARFYGSRNGRFTGPDPLTGDPSDSQSWNRYTYGLNDPINLIDPSGESPVWHCIAFVLFNEDTLNILGQWGKIIGWLPCSNPDANSALTDVYEKTTQFITAPRDSGCMATTAGGMMIAGATGGAAAGLAGGPAAVLTVPAASLNGAFGGGVVGYGYGLIRCMSNTGKTGSGSGGSGGKNGWNNRIAREKAEGLGFKEAKGAPFDSRNQLTFKSGNRWITPDIDGHTGYHAASHEIRNSF